MKDFFIVARNEEERNLALIKDIISYIEKKGGTCSYQVNPEDNSNEKLNVPEQAQCILTIGGDGTLIRAAQNTAGKNIPLLGINRGHLGYLCDLDDENIYSGIDRLLQEKYEIEQRMMLSGYIHGQEGDSDWVPALNDIVLCSPYGLEVIHLTVYVNGQYLYSYNCDGMIFSTPTGSTAYNLSAHGPIVDPKTNLILITPINPHTLNARSIIIDQTGEIEVEIIPRRFDGKEMAQVSFDGNHQQLLKPSQRLKIHKSPETSSMIRFQQYNYLERIRSKMQEI